MEDNHRIHTLLNHFGLKKNAFAKILGYKNGTIFYHIYNGRNGISADLAKRIGNSFPEINQNWLLTGRGEMLLSETYSPDKNLIENIEDLKVRIKGLDARLELLEQKFSKIKSFMDKEK